MELTLGARKQITPAQLDRWPKATRAEKCEILKVCPPLSTHRRHPHDQQHRIFHVAVSGAAHGNVSADHVGGFQAPLLVRPGAALQR